MKQPIHITVMYWERIDPKEVHSLEMALSLARLAGEDKGAYIDYKSGIPYYVRPL